MRRYLLLLIKAALIELIAFAAIWVFYSISRRITNYYDWNLHLAVSVVSTLASLTTILIIATLSTVNQWWRARKSSFYPLIAGAVTAVPMWLYVLAVYADYPRSFDWPVLGLMNGKLFVDFQGLIYALCVTPIMVLSVTLFTAVENLFTRRLPNGPTREKAI